MRQFEGRALGSVGAGDLSMNRTVAHRWMSRVVAALIGVSAAANVLFNGSQLVGFGGWSFVLLLGLFALIFSFAGVVGAIWLWKFQPLGWWIAAWFCLFSLLSALAPFAIFGRLPELDTLQSGWLLAMGASLVYLFTPSARAAHRITAQWPKASVKIFGAGLLCVLLQFGYSAYFVARATWFSG
jgi:hypothetical protein